MNTLPFSWGGETAGQVRHRLERSQKLRIGRWKIRVLLAVELLLIGQCLIWETVLDGPPLIQMVVCGNFGCLESS